MPMATLSGTVASFLQVRHYFIFTDWPGVIEAVAIT
jgi:hypothetical protein